MSAWHATISTSCPQRMPVAHAHLHTHRSELPARPLQTVMQGLSVTYSMHNFTAAPVIPWNCWPEKLLDRAFAECKLFGIDCTSWQPAMHDSCLLFCIASSPRCASQRAPSLKRMWFVQLMETRTCRLSMRGWLLG